MINNYLSEEVFMIFFVTPPFKVGLQDKKYKDFSPQT